ncbi:flagellar biosynthesis repressor FlbT [Methylocystis parvus]|uniref:Flagellar biosynthesis repressor FlbT n=1 Tax=Methylocystis parvus TaxID=134 RepID=A0A6B8M2H2_9HYPH|nr:flagellar biosynthesis repressor FlbT [Methylocystis parvus]QGM98004.1 flagellar biosynthesis repressor FlbT [Methylocystis parvus]WBK01680.1 flagellar biosynthesis repressor FlbT [Methylocystis parvus OBBP]
MNISLRRGERIFVNGAVLRVDRKVCIELLNDVTFLLENHVMQEEEATTPLRRLYFVIQTMIISPNDCDAAVALCRETLVSLSGAAKDPRIVAGLGAAIRHIADERPFEALKAVRAMFQIEAELAASPQTEQRGAA